MIEVDNNSPLTGWSEGVIDLKPGQPHINVTYAENIVIAYIINHPELDEVIVQFNPDNQQDDIIRELIKGQKRLLDCLFNREMLINRWEYAIYHCNTTSNAYSKIDNDVIWCDYL
ncbi:MAG: hypothetical protein DIZ80_00140 [endosymbiont of Galathealinum brachiosum]|uniref:Uncharacterized protein n=1 Tax=endosymbiont of Galathealinum brachiosum TaxID=2200906 RepID=A0A370DLY4_9GAMM|nr:MAG: hypothetical protein DIZ80_00140 [endosymbiont of Galathealinum brachiosum]